MIGECPLSGIKAVSMVDKGCCVLSLSCVSPKSSLASIHVAGPLIEGQDSGETCEIRHAIQHLNGHVVEDLPLGWIEHVTRTKLEAGLAPHDALRKLDVHLRRVLDEPLVDFHGFCRGHRQSHDFGQSSSKPLICQHPQMLRIIAKLYDVVVAVGTKH